jgi:hypothetical protein
MGGTLTEKHGIPRQLAKPTRRAQVVGDLAGDVSRGPLESRADIV